VIYLFGTHLSAGDVGERIP